jgi:hypothetical protein
MIVFEGTKSLDKWYPVRLVDALNLNTPELAIGFASVTVAYGFEAAAADVPYAVLIGDWREQGGGNYWLSIGAGEFANEGKYTVRVSAVGCADETFYVQVNNLTYLANAILDADLQLHLGAGVGFRNIGNILGQLAQSEFELRTNVFATIAVPAQGITASMARKRVLQYQQVDMSYTKNWAAPDRTYYILYHYNAQRLLDIAKASLGTIW